MGGYTRIYTPCTWSKKWLLHSTGVAHYCALQPLYEGAAAISKKKTTPDSYAAILPWQRHQTHPLRHPQHPAMEKGGKWWTSSQNAPRLMVSTNSWSSGNLHGCQRQTFPALIISGVAGTKLPNGHPAPMQTFTPCRSAWQ